jgi:hypothetical protein
MTDQAELLLREVFAEDAEAVVPRHDLAELARQRVGRRRRRQRVVALAATVVTVAGVVTYASTRGEHRPAVRPSPVPAAGTPIEAASIDQLVPVVKKAHLQRPVTIDSGAVSLAPTVAAPKISESRAFQMWAAAVPAGSMETTDDPVVFLADATLAVAVRPTGPGNPEPALPPQFSHRPAWVFVWGLYTAVYHCGANPGSPSAVPTVVVEDPVAQVELIAADSSGEGVVYTLAAAPCGRLVPAGADIASYFESVPWVSSVGSDGQPAASVTVPDCAIEGGASAGGLTTNPTVSANVEVFMVRPPCSGATRADMPMELAGATDGPRHGPTGLSLGRVSKILDGAFSLTYYDGSTHTLTVSPGS